MKFKKECCRCGFCCVITQCPISLSIYGEREQCPALEFNSGEATCSIINVVPIGDGCCISAKAYQDGIEFDFATLDNNIKKLVSQRVRGEI